MANILYLGDNATGTTSSHRAKAMERLGHKIYVLDPYTTFSSQLNAPLLGSVHFRTGYRLLNRKVSGWLSDNIKGITFKPDILWVTSGELFGPDSLKILKSLGCPIILYNNDDPTGGRDGRRFDLLLKALPYYDLCVVMRNLNVSEFKARGAKEVIRVFMSYDEEVHKPFDSASEIPEAYRSDVAFIGTWMRYEKRDEFLLDLIQKGINVSIWGNRWQKSPYFDKLQAHWRGNAISGRNYVAAIQGSKICLGMLSKGNRDLHTTRSLEIPFAGGLFCGERTSEHQQMYAEGTEAVFWSNASECADVCTELLKDDVRREKIRLAGMKKVRKLELGNEDLCNKILKLFSKNT